MLIYRRHAMIAFYEKMLRTLVDDYEDESDVELDEQETCAAAEMN